MTGLAKRSRHTNGIDLLGLKTAGVSPDLSLVVLGNIEKECGTTSSIPFGRLLFLMMSLSNSRMDSMCGTRRTFGGVHWVPGRNILFNAANSRLTVVLAAPDGVTATLRHDCYNCATWRHDK